MDAISRQIKLEITVQFLAIEDNLRSLFHSFIFNIKPSNKQLLY